MKKTTDIYVYALTFIMSVFLMLSPLCSEAQFVDPREAEEYFENKDFRAALKTYRKLLEKEPREPEYLYRAGYSVLHIAHDKKEAIPLLEKAVKVDKPEDDAWYFLGMAYHIQHEFDKALEAYKKYKEIDKGDYTELVDRQIEMVKNAKQLVSAPVNVKFENAGPRINSEYPDYYPFVTQDESMMAFTSRRKDNKGSRPEFDGYYSSDVWIAEVKNGEYQKAENAGSLVNSIYDEQVVGLSPSGEKLFVYIDHIDEYGDIYFSEKSRSRYGRLDKFGEIINTKKGFESAATISPDGNTLFFASKRKDGIGGKDIYMTRKLPTGDWAKPQNLGETVNTKYDEDFPSLFYDGKTLYFASEGHNSIGGYDIFKTKWNPGDNTWTRPENIGYPVNTTEDNLTISFAEDQFHAYVSMWRDDSFGDLDIYMVTFLEKDARQTVIKSQLKVSGDSTKVPEDAFVSVTDNRTGMEVGTYTPDADKGDFVIILTPGSYQLLIDAPGYAPFTKDITIEGKSDFVPFMQQDFELTPAN